MEQRVSDEFDPGECSPPLTADTVTPFIQTPFLPAPNRREFDAAKTTQYTDTSSFTTQRSLYPKLPQLQGFERPNFTLIAILIVLCCIAYPALHILTLVAKDKSLFTVRLIVALWGSGVAFVLGYTLLRIGVKHLEAATWATAIHLSYEESGMKMRDLAGNSQNPTSFLSALRICLRRFGSRETATPRELHDKRPWSLFLGFFIVLAILGPTLPFLFGRVIGIETFIRNQRMVYQEVLIAGDLSQHDVGMAVKQLGAFQSFIQTWTLLPYGASPPDYVEFAYSNETVYFPQPRLSQFIPGGSGLGIFDTNQTVSLKDSPNGNAVTLLASGDAPNKGMGLGAILRYPQWGIRIHCEKLPDPHVNLIPRSPSNFTYAFLPQDFLRGLFAGYGMDLPASLTKPDLALLDQNDTIPSVIDSSKISYFIQWANNGVAHSFHTRTILDTGGISDRGWTTVETVLIRLNNSLTPSGRFPVYSNQSDANGVETRIGYDAAICVEMYEPWIIEAYNTSVGSPTILRIVEKGYGKTPLPSGKIQGYPIQNTTRYLNTTGKNPAFFVAHGNSVNQMVKDNGRDFYYVPSPTAVSFTDGAGPEGYTELLADRFAIIRARVDAANVLPYLAGSAPIVAQLYQDLTLASANYVRWHAIGLLMLIMILGIIGELFVPTLPHNIPRRGFGVYSWLALLQSQELRFEVSQDLNKMSHEELEKNLRDVKVKFVSILEEHDDCDV